MALLPADLGKKKHYSKKSLLQVFKKGFTPFSY